MDNQIISFKPIEDLVQNEITDVKNILDEYYLNYDVLYHYLTKKSNTHICIYRIDNLLVGFYMIGIKIYKKQPIVHLGQLCVARNFESKKIGIKLLSFIKSIGFHEDSIFYATTSSFSAFKAANFVYNNVYPDLNGKTRQEAIDKLEVIKKMNCWDSDASSPHIFRKIAKISRYKDCQTKTKYLQHNLFDKYILNESEGDRIVLIINP